MHPLLMGGLIRVDMFADTYACLSCLLRSSATESAKEVAKVEKAVLSTTAKAKERQKKKDAEKQSKSGAAGDKSGED